MLRREDIAKTLYDYKELNSSFQDYVGAVNRIYSINIVGTDDLYIYSSVGDPVLISDFVNWINDRQTRKKRIVVLEAELKELKAGL